MKHNRLHLDFETYSDISLKRAGSARYASDPSTEVLYACWGFDDTDWVDTWCPVLSRKDALALGFPEDWHYGPRVPATLNSAVRARATIVAHNAQFERNIWHHVVTPRHGGARSVRGQFQCTAARAAASGLPRSLEHVAMALGTAHKKDTEGAKFLKLFAQPKKATKKDPRTRIYPADMPTQFKALGEYCQQDVRTEQAVDTEIPHLHPDEQRLFTYDMLINERGIRLDVPLVHKASSVVQKLEHVIVTRVKSLTASAEYPDGLRPTQRDKMLAFFKGAGVELPNMQAETVRNYIRDNLRTVSPIIKEILQLRIEAGKSSTKKFVSMLSYASPVDNRARGTLLFYGAHTGRWSGKGVQPHNFIRGNIKYDEQLRIFKLLELADPDVFTLLYDWPISTIGACMRGFIVPALGRILRVVDYAAIEARVLAWLAGDEEILEAYRRGFDVYKVMASRLFKVPYEAVTDEQRRIGKNLILGCGYGLGAVKFVVYCLKAGVVIELDFAKAAVKTYRTERKRVVAYWYDVERAAMAAVRDKRTEDSPVVLGRIAFFIKDQWLCVKLPSGRCLRYFRPKIAVVERFGEPALQLTFKVEFRGRLYSETTYGGKLVENIVQAVARDFLVNGMFEAEKEGYPVIGTVHDEILTEPLIDHGSVHELEKIVSRIPAWGEGCPISAEGFESYRYRKG